MGNLYRTVYIDTETTGLDPCWNDLLEIAIVNDQGEVLMDTLIRPKRRQSWLSAQAIHGISPEDVKNAPTLEDVLPAVVAAVTGARLVIYNASFDMGFLPEYVANAPARIECCMLHFAEEYGDYSDYHDDYRWQSLATAACYVGHVWQGSTHRALADALACRAVWHYLTGSAAYRDEVDARRISDIRRDAIVREALHALERYEAQLAKRWQAAQERSSRVIHRFYLRQTMPRHWLTELRADQLPAQLAAVFLGLPVNLPPECYAPGVEIQAVYHRQRDIPDHLAPMSWFPNEKWIRVLLIPVAAFSGPNTGRALYAKSQLDEIKKEYWRRFAPLPERWCTRTMLCREGISDGVIEALAPAAERYNGWGCFWYPVYNRDELP